MKIMKHDNPNFGRLIQCASTSKARPSLQVVHYDAETKYLLASDGLRLFATKSLTAPSKGEGSYDIKPYAEKGEFVSHGLPFIPWKNLIKVDFKYRVGFQVPDFVAKLHQTQKTSKAPVTFFVEDLAGRTTITTELGVSSDTRPGRYAHSINLAHLRPFAGTAVQILLPDNGNGAIVVTDSMADSTRPLEFDTFLLVAKSKVTDNIWGASWVKPTPDYRQPDLFTDIIC